MPVSILYLTCMKVIYQEVNGELRYMGSSSKANPQAAIREVMATTFFGRVMTFRAEVAGVKMMHPVKEKICNIRLHVTENFMGNYHVATR